MKVKRRFRITLTDESHLEQVFSLQLSPARLVLAGGVALLCIALFGLLIVATTPLKRGLPGYLKADQRLATEASQHRLDSLYSIYAQNEAFLDNISEVLDTDRNPQDSLSTGRPALGLTPDSIMPTSIEEARFVAGMRQREKFNLNVIAPIDADGVMFHTVHDNLVVAESQLGLTDPALILPARATVASVADGVVMAVYAPRVGGGYTVVLQHPMGFATAYSGLSSAIVSSGDEVNGGTVVGFAPSAGSRQQVHMRMWHDGKPVPPADYLPGLNSGL